MKKIGIVLTSILLVAGCHGSRSPDDGSSLWERKVVHEPDDGAAPWAKFAGDLDADGLPEILVGLHGSSQLLSIPAARGVRVVVDEYAVMTDGEVVDVDGDGINDIVLPTEQGLLLLRGPGWQAEVVSERRLHDVESADMDMDGRPEIVVRNQTAFGSGQGDIIILSRDGEDKGWSERALPLAEGEGFAVADLDADGDPDIVAGAVWFENRPGGDWTKHRYSDTWVWPHVKVVVADINGDGRVDIALAPSELEGQRYRVSWFSAPEDRYATWPEQVLVEDIEAVVHSLRAGDVDLDGDVDLLYAEMHQGEDPDEVVLLENSRNGASFRKTVIDSGGSHNLQLVDLDLDGDLDMFGANWSGPDQDVVLWTNTVCTQPWSRWDRHVVDDDRPGRAVFIFASDLNGDRYPDLAAGAYVYLNPGASGTAWRRVPLEAGARDVIFASDVDRDGDTDLLATFYAADERSFALYRNDGTGMFRVEHSNVPMTGDFLQGTALDAFSGSTLSLALSWHGAGSGIELLSLPRSDTGNWLLNGISEFSQDEALSAGDIDGDGLSDLFLGTSWLRNGGSSWSRHVVDDTEAPPDRNRLADLDLDGDLDAVVGFQAISTTGDLVWYEAPGDPRQKWLRHPIGRIVGPMSLDLADMDADGDLDVVAGEHNLEDPSSAALWIFENIDGLAGAWEPHRIHVGDEHHDGARTVDVDLDGDQDVVSIGWGHNEVIWYENRMPTCPAAPVSSLEKAGVG